MADAPTETTEELRKIKGLFTSDIYIEEWALILSSGSGEVSFLYSASATSDSLKEPVMA